MNYLTAAEIAGFFEEWAKQSSRKCKTPSDQQCGKMARIFNESTIPSDRTMFGPDEAEAVEKVKKIVAAASKLLSAISEYAAAMKKMNETIGAVIAPEFSRSVLEEMGRIEAAYDDSYERAHMIPLLQNHGIYRLAHECDEFMRWRDEPKAGKRENFARKRIIYLAAVECRRILIDINWRDTEPSLDSDSGIVAFVVAKCVSQVEGKCVAASSMAEAIAEMKTRYKPNREVILLSLPPKKLG